MEILLSNVRSFAGSHKIRLRPLTLLVGENSSGKSTMLSVIARVSDFSFLAGRPSFNVDPFDLGTYQSIASRKGAKNAPGFGVGFTLNSLSGGQGPSVTANYINRAGQPSLASLILKDAEGTVEINMGDEEIGARAILPGASIDERFSGPRPPAAEVAAGIGPFFPFHLLEPALLRPASAIGQEEGTSSSRQRVVRWLITFLNHVSESVMPALALAPVRTRPRRTYDELAEDFTPEGAHIPLVIAHILRNGDEEGRGRLLRVLRTFGQDSGLFRSIYVKRLGRNPGDPFQLHVTVAGPRANIADVGYGVSQALPIVVQSILLAKGRRLLLQQPEVHLHPRGQAALGSLFAQFAAAKEREFVVETHSDYLVDRVRLEVSRGRLKPEDVQILYFNNPGGRTKVYPLDLDTSGNVLRAPKFYRRFFLDETVSLLTPSS